ncbi:rhomboid family intramembrane serine protease [Myxococcota bacterium]|nr:rhomboid family intramembrane serine protease [Myxococcota bacterium]
MRPMSGGAGISFPRPGRVGTALIAANVAIYVVYLVLLRSGAAWVQALRLAPADVFDSGQVWQPLTYMWLHSPTSPGHLVFNMLWLWIFGASLERWWGPQRFLWAYLLFGLAGAALTLLFGLVAHTGALGASVAAFWAVPHLGASGAVMGLTVAWGLVHANETMQFFLLGQMKGKTFVLLVVGIELLTALSFDPTSSTSHFGGMIAAFVLVRGLWRPSAWGELMKRASLERRRKKIESELRVIQGGRADPAKPTKKTDWN